MQAPKATTKTPRHQEHGKRLTLGVFVSCYFQINGSTDVTAPDTNPSPSSTSAPHRSWLRLVLPHIITVIVAIAASLGMLVLLSPQIPTAVPAPTAAPAPPTPAHSPRPTARAVPPQSTAL